jgi:hypothetical protein
MPAPVPLSHGTFAAAAADQHSPDDERKNQERHHGEDAPYSSLVVKE